MKKIYSKLSMDVLCLEAEGGFLVGSKVDEVKLEVEVDDYITIDKMEVTFE